MVSSYCLTQPRDHRDHRHPPAPKSVCLGRESSGRIPGNLFQAIKGEKSISKAGVLKLKAKLRQTAIRYKIP